MQEYFSVDFINSLSTLQFAFFLVCVTCLTAIALWYTFANLKKARVIEDTPTSKLRSAAQGFVEISGRGEEIDDTYVISPLTGTRCLWYRFKVERYNTTGKKKSWDKIESGVSDDFFRINDNTGLCIIDPSGADVSVFRCETWRGSTPRPTTRHKKTNPLLEFSEYRYTEERLHISDSVYVLGNLQTLGGGHDLQCEKAMMRDIVREWKKDWNALLEKFDTNKDGELSLEEWKRVQMAANFEAEKRRTEESLSPEIHILVKPPTRDYPFIISSKSQRELSASYKYSAFGGFVFGLPLVAYLLWSLVVRTM